MFKSIELGLKISKEEYKKRLPKLRADLLAAQAALKNSPVPVIVIVSGVEGAGKAEVVNALNEWMDPRGIETHAFWTSSDEERDRPRYWRFWRTLPARGRIGIFFGSWYTEPIIERVQGRIKSAAFDREMRRIAAFEKMLVEDNALIVKLWFHLSKKEQKKRFKKLEKDPNTRWRVTPMDWKFHKRYEEFAAVCEQAIRFTDSGDAPWHLIDSADRQHRNLQAGQILLDAIRNRLERLAAAPKRERTDPPIPKTLDKPTVLDRVNLSLKCPDAEYKKKLQKYQALWYKLTWAAHQKRISTVGVFEGWDAAGKGGAIRRVTAAMDAKLYRVISIAAPTEEERAHHYLWRFWRHIPPPGHVTLYDRSWYGRVLVERVEGFATTDEWSRAYHEINEFEAQLAESGMVIVKFWVHISPEEQLRRFKERESTEFKRYKITDEDWRNRQKWNAYVLAVHDMVTRTSTDVAPWILVPGNDKQYARIQILKSLCRELEKRL